MANQQLVDYIKGQIAAGVSRLDLEKAVTSAGWSAKDSVDAFAVAEGRAPAAPVVPAAPRAPMPPAQQPVASVQLQPMRPATMQMSIDTGSRRSHTLLWTLLGILVVVLIGAGAAYAYRTQLQTIVGFYLGETPTPVTDTYVPPVDITTTATTTASTTPVTPPATTTSTTTP